MHNLVPKAEMVTSLPQPGRILDLVDESVQVRTLVLDLHLQAEPGQFVMAWLPGVDEKPFSLVRAAPATLTIARVGPFTKEVFCLDIGDRLWLRGPLGRPFTLPSPPPPAAHSTTSGTSHGSRPAHALL
ncbi:hypothetical protein ACFLYD_08625, partial [Chloroflexota bacterium]